MKYLLDTQIYIWILQDNHLIKKDIRIILENSNNTFFLSSETFRKIAIKYRIGKIKFGDKFEEVISKIPKNFGIKTIQLNVKHLELFAQLSQTVHKDPADLLIISQAIKNNLTLISADGNFPYYRKVGLKLIEA
ncbi:MAG: type II toxin-antitoxin system VapC family toxin [Raineya sp.]